MTLGELKELIKNIPSENDNYDIVISGMNNHNTLSYDINIDSDRKEINLYENW